MEGLIVERLILAELKSQWHSCYQPISAMDLDCELSKWAGCVLFFVLVYFMQLSYYMVLDYPYYTSVA